MVCLKGKQNQLRPTPLAYIWLLLLCNLGAIAAIQPADKAVLNHTQVMFTWDEYPGADAYELVIEGKLVQQKIAVQSLARLVTKGLAFGRQYQWNYRAFKKGKVVFQSPGFIFRIAAHPLVDSTLFRYRVRSQRAKAYQDNLIFMDHLGVAVNREGQPVWYLPYDSFDLAGPPKYRNLQMTASGSITYIRGSDCYEKDLQGQILWAAPNDGAVSGASTEFYHHDFAKDANGRYMVCSYQYVTMPNIQQPSINSRVRYNTLIQYDAMGKLLWKWREQDHIQPAEVFDGSAPGETEVAGTHLNGFTCNDKTGVCVLSFRNNSTLLVIKKATGQILQTLRGAKTQLNGIDFAAQHGPVFLPNGELLLYNNNVKAVPDSGQLIYPKIVQLRFDKNYKTAQKVWEYECRMKDYPKGLAGKEGFVNLLPNGHILVDIGGGNKVLEVDRTKQIVWEMDTEAFDAKTQAWLPFGNYRTNFASSLFPYFFTVQQPSGPGPVQLGQTIHLKINNDGSEADVYKLELFSNGVFAPFSRSFRLGAGSMLEHRIPLKKGTATAKDGGSRFAIIRITPQSNPNAVKELTYEIMAH